MGLQEGLVFTNDNCVGCNRCIKACSAMVPVFRMSRMQKGTAV